MSALCLPILLILMKEVQGEWLKFGNFDYLRCSCVIVEKSWTLNSYFLVLFFFLNDTFSVVFPAWRRFGLASRSFRFARLTVAVGSLSS